jgi:uncharacterized Zn finger protein
MIPVVNKSRVPFCWDTIIMKPLRASHVSANGVHAEVESVFASSGLRRVPHICSYEC